MRYVIYGAGAVGATIGGLLHAAGRDVVLIARGAHLDALRRDGLRLIDPDRERTLPVIAVGSPAEVAIGAGDAVLLAMKTQDTEDALDALRASAPPDVAVVCAQNGVENERLALRRFAHVYAMRVILPAEHLEPGVVLQSAAPVAGVLDLSPYPGPAPDDRAEAIAADLTAAGFSSEATPRALALKYGKLLSNVANAIDAAIGDDPLGDAIHERARAEARACYAAAGIDAASDAEDAARRATVSASRPIGGRARNGGSTWQSLARGTGRVEADWLNGEVVLLGRLHGVPTPVNAVLQRAANEMAREHRVPGSMTGAELEELIAAEPGA